jgi:hypothetical protein
MVQGLVGGVVGSVANAFSPSEPPAPAPTTSLPFSSALSRLTPAVPSAPSATSPGILRADQWNQMSDTDVKSWAQSLIGHHVDTTNFSGHAISGTVQGIQQTGNGVALNVGGQLVSLSELKQVSWSSVPA